jgi:antitoxin (DNA-binding transcriptional repressor) of toxin-antitoxin stability system
MRGACAGGSSRACGEGLLTKELPEATLSIVKTVGLKTLKNKLSEYVRCAAAGETILITDRQRVVAEIGPPRPEQESYYSNPKLNDAVRQGWITPGARRGEKPPPRLPAVASLEEILQEIDQDREDP